MSNQEFKVENGTYLGEAFSGQVYTVPIDEADKFYESHKEDMVASGFRSFLSSMRIPTGFFKERNPVLQQDLVIDTKATVLEKSKAKELFVLVIDGVIQFVAPHLPSSLGWEDPKETLGLDPEVWYPTEFDTNSGCVQYLNFPDRGNLTQDQYYPVAYLTLPIFYAKPIKVDLGIYKLICQNGAMDDISTSGVSFKPSSLNPDIFAAFANGVSDATKKLSVEYNKFFDFLNAASLNVDEARTLMRGMLEASDPLVPTRVVKRVLQHVELLRSGKDVPSNSPDTVDNQYDLFDLFTFYSHQGNTKLTSRNNTDRKTFRYFYQTYRDGSEESKVNVNLPEYLGVKEEG